MSATPLESIRFNHENGHYGQAAGTIGYLLRIISRLEANIQVMALAYQDPDNTPTTDPHGDNDCPCVHRVQDDAGITLVAEYNPRCPTHGKH